MYCLQCELPELAAACILLIYLYNPNNRQIATEKKQHAIVTRFSNTSNNYVFQVRLCIYGGVQSSIYTTLIKERVPF
jgi:cyanate permease